MAKTLKQVQEENKKLRMQISEKKEKLKLEAERIRLLKENKKLLKYSKNPKLYDAAAKLGKSTSKLGKSSRIAAKKIGKGIWGTLQKMEATRLRNEALQRKLARKSKTKKKR